MKVILSSLHPFKKRQKNLGQTQVKQLPKMLLQIETAGQKLRHE